jgi:hypothetical protein
MRTVPIAAMSQRVPAFSFGAIEFPSMDAGSDLIIL